MICGVCGVSKPKRQCYKIKRCKECHKAWRKAYYQLNKEHTKVTVAAWIRANKDKHAEYCKKWRNDNPDWQKNYRKNNPHVDMYNILKYHVKKDGMWR